MLNANDYKLLVNICQLALKSEKLYPSQIEDINYMIKKLYEEIFKSNQIKQEIKTLILH